MEIFKLFGSIMINSDGANKSLDEVDKKAQGTSKSFGAMIGSAAKMGAGIVLAVGAAAVAVGGLAVRFTDDLQKALNGVQASTGIADEAMVGMKDTMVAIYNNNFGENFEEIGAAMARINQQTGLTGEALQGVTENALALKDTFGMEVETSITGANQLMKQFGLTGEESYNLIAQGAQWGLDANGDLLDTLREYSGTFAAQGFSAEEMFNMLQNGAASGVRDVDLLADAVKEFGIRSVDGSKASAEGFAALGLNASTMTASFAAGGETAKAAFGKTTTALIAMKDPVAQTAAGVALFGTQFEDLGIKGITALVNTQGEISKTVDSLGTINAVKYDTFGKAMQGIKRNLETGLLLPLGEAVMPALNSMASWIQTNMPAIQNEIEYAMGIVKDVLGKVVDAVKTYVVPQFERFAEIIRTNMPAIKQAISDMYNRVKPHFDQLVGVIRNDLMPIIQGMWNLIERAMPTIKTVFGLAMDGVGFALGLAMDIIGTFIGIAKGIYDLISPGVNKVIDIFNAVAGAIQWAKDKLDIWNRTPAKDKSTTVTTTYRNVSTATTLDDRHGNAGYKPPFAVGTRYLPRDMLIQAHEGEMIVPKSENPYANSGGKITGGGGLTLYIQNLYNNRPQSIEELAQELEMYRLMHSKALGGA